MLPRTEQRVLSACGIKGKKLEIKELEYQPKQVEQETKALAA
jgi:hypothetical protein